MEILKWYGIITLVLEAIKYFRKTITGETMENRLLYFASALCILPIIVYLIMK